MSKLVERGFLESAHTIVEAGTGVGKSLAYLVPALRSGKKVVVTTATIALQEQLVRKDIPLVIRALGVPARVELLKGRSHYLCRQKLDKMRAERLIAQSASMEAMWTWADRTATGDRAELRFAPAPLEWEALDADADDCVGEFCERFRDCWFFKRRDAAKYADIVVVNHALFFLDLAMGGTLLPPYDFAILDEAHQAERWASAALTATLSPASVNRLMRRVHRNYQLPAGYDAEIDEGMRGLVQTLARVPGERYPLRANENAPDALRALQSSFFRLENWLLANWQAGLKRPPDNVAEAERRRDLVMRGVLAHISTIDRTALGEEEAITWVERLDGESRYEVNSAPFDVAEYLRDALFRRTQSVVLTSATIATGNSFAFLKEALGVEDAQEYVAPSPFDYRSQARLYVAPADCNPKDPRFRRARRAAGRRAAGRLERTGVRALHVVRAAARSVRAGARARSVPDEAAGRAPARAPARLVPRARPMRCCSGPARSGKGSTSSATGSRASSSTACPFPRRAIRWWPHASRRSRPPAVRASRST